MGVRLGFVGNYLKIIKTITIIISQAPIGKQIVLKVKDFSVYYEQSSDSQNSCNYTDNPFQGIAVWKMVKMLLIFQRSNSGLPRHKQCFRYSGNALFPSERHSLHIAHQWDVRQANGGFQANIQRILKICILLECGDIWCQTLTENSDQSQERHSWQAWNLLHCCLRICRSQRQWKLLWSRYHRQNESIDSSDFTELPFYVYGWRDMQMDIEGKKT